MAQINNRQLVEKSYQNSSNLQTRINIHAKYGQNPIPFADWVFSHYRFFDGCRILELGCGTAAMWKGRTGRIGAGSSLLLSDFSQGILTEAEERLGQPENVRFERINMEEIPYPDKSFDIVIANHVLHHVPHVPQAIGEVRRVLRPGGTFYATAFGEGGTTAYLKRTLEPFGICEQPAPFTLQKGPPLLRQAFSQVTREDYEDELAVTEVADWVDYIYSMTSMIGLSERVERDTLIAYYEGMRDSGGVLHVPKENGILTAR